MRLFIAEKPSLARAIADVLPKPHRKGDGFIECGNGQVVTWCIGHLLEQAQPDAYEVGRWNDHIVGQTVARPRSISVIVVLVGAATRESASRLSGCAAAAGRVVVRGSHHS